MAPIRVLVVDDHPVLRAGVAAFLDAHDDITVVGEAEDGAQALATYRALKPDVTLMDLNMPGGGGVAAITAIRAEHVDARILVLTTYAGDAQAVRALRAGASGYILKSGPREAMVAAIHTLHRGRRYIHGEVAAEIANHVANDPLSDRELATLKLVAEGRNNREIAKALGLSEQTVKGHLKNTFAKLDVTDRTHAVTIALRRGILEL